MAGLAHGSCAGWRDPGRAVPEHKLADDREQAMTSGTPPTGGTAPAAAWLRLHGLDAEAQRAALSQERLGDLVDEMEREAGPVPPEAYERVLAQWRAHA